MSYVASRYHIPEMNTPPAEFSAARDLPDGFVEFYRTLHDEFAARRNALMAKRAATLAASLRGERPDYLPPSAAHGEWSVALPEWCSDQRNQMTGPADDAELIVKMLNSGAPGVMIDLEDSTANTFEHTMRGIDNAIAAYYGELSYVDTKRGGKTVTIAPSKTVLWTRVRGLHVSQAGILFDPTPASLFDVALLAYRLDFSRLAHGFTIYIPKSESAEEGLWWRDLFNAIAEYKGVPRSAITVMALVEAHPFAYQIEEFAYNLCDYIVGFNLGRWDYMASLIHFMLDDPAWVLPDRNTIPLDVAFFQALRAHIPEIAHKHGMLAMGGMTALFPDRSNPELNARALAALERDKRNEAAFLFDGAWTGHPDQNAVAVAQFPVPNQNFARVPNADSAPDLRPSIVGIGERTTDGTRTAIRTVIRYRAGYLAGRGASLLDGYMEDLATDRIYRLMIAQRIAHGMHTEAEVTTMFDEELAAILSDPRTVDEAERYRAAREQSEAMITYGYHDPV